MIYFVNLSSMITFAAEKSQKRGKTGFQKSQKRGKMRFQKSQKRDIIV